MVAEGEFFEDKAPKTVAALWAQLPISDRQIRTRWSGDAWRTEQNYELQPKGAPVRTWRMSGTSNVITTRARTNIKVGFAYGEAKWLRPVHEPSRHRRKSARLTRTSTPSCGGASAHRLEPLAVEITQIGVVGGARAGEEERRCNSAGHPDVPRRPHLSLRIRRTAADDVAGARGEGLGLDSLWANDHLATQRAHAGGAGQSGELL